jgi:hypothetical protein
MRGAQLQAALPDDFLDLQGAAGAMLSRRPF